MNIETLRLTRNILLRTFVVGIIFAMLIAAITFGAWDSWIGFASKFTHVTEATIAPIILNFFADVRLVLLFLVLAPALALHWTIKAEEAHHKPKPANTVAHAG